jgi:hypothetical protein
VEFIRLEQSMKHTDGKYDKLNERVKHAESRLDKLGFIFSASVFIGSPVMVSRRSGKRIDEARQPRGTWRGQLLQARAGLSNGSATVDHRRSHTDSTDIPARM